MATTSFTALRRLVGTAFALMLLSFYLTGAAIGQASPAVTATAPAGLTHPTGWSTIEQTAIDSNGDWLVVDLPNGAAYLFPANGGAMITLVAPGGLNGGANPVALFDPANNIYFSGDWSNCLEEYAYDATTNSWPGLSVLTAANPTPNQCGSSPGEFAQYNIFPGPGFPEGTWYLQPWGVTLGNSNTGTNPNNIIVGNQNGNYIFSLNVQGAWSNPNVPQNGNGDDTNVTGIIYGMTNRPISIAADPEGDIFFVEDQHNSGSNHGYYLPGLYEIPASDVAADIATANSDGTEYETALSSDCPTPTSGQPTGSTCLARVDPNLPNVVGVVTDAAGNLYISDASEGVFMVPNPSGTPDTADAVMLTSIPAQGEVAIDPARKILYVPTTQNQQSSLTTTPPYVLQKSGQADVAKLGVGYAEFGTSNVGTATATTLPIQFSFNSSVTPANFSIVEDGMTTPEFSITGGTCTTGTPYAALSSCAENLNFTPAAAGSSSAELLMLDANNNILASMPLHGTGLGANAQAAPGMESTIGATLQTPTQVATDALGNVYVADPGLGKVLRYPAGSSTGVSIPAAACVTCKSPLVLVSPTGVAVDGVGDVFIADSGASGGGAVYEVPFGPSGLNSTGIVTLASGLGTSGLNLAVDALGDLYVADPSNGQVVRLAGIGASSSGALALSTTYLTTGSTPSSPAAVAVDSNNNLYVIDSDSENLFEFTAGLGTPTIVLSSLSGDTGVAVDPSGAVYLSSTSGTTRIPIVGGNVGTPTPIAPDVTSTSSVALDRSGNVYVTPVAGPGVTLVSTVGAVNLANPGSTPVSITNVGNAPLTITGYTNSTTVLDSVTIANFTGADGTCVSGSPIAAGSACQVIVTFNPGPGQQGALSGWVQAASNALNAPITIDTTGTGPALTNSQTQVAMGSGPQVIDAPLTVTVSSASGAGTTPTGTVQVSFTSWTVSVPTTCTTPPCAPTINPVTATASSPLTNGQAQFALAPVLAGNESFTVGYTGDRTYGSSTGTATANVAKSSIVGFIADPNPPPYLPFVEESSGLTPYDGTNQYWTYSMPVTVNTAAGIPTGTVTFMDNSSTCPPGTSASGVGAATCQLVSYSGIACPAQSGAGVQYPVNNGTPSASAGATATFLTSCLQMPEFTTYSPVVSTHYITPVYSGDANFTGATDPVSSLYQVIVSPLVNITPTAPAAPSAPISVASLTVQPGSTANLTLYLAPLLGYGFQGKGGTLNDYNFPVTLTCDNLPPHTACTFTYPSSVSPYQPTAPNSTQICPQPDLDTNSDTAAAFETLAENGGCNTNGVGVVTLTINTNVSTGTTTTSQNTAAPITLASIFGLGMIGLFFRRKAFEKGRRLLMVVLMIVGGGLAATLSACNTTNLTPLAQLSTPPGTYAVSVTASQVGTQCVPLISATSNCTTASGGEGKLVTGSNNQVSLPYYINLTVQ